MELSQDSCKKELESINHLPRKYYGQVFTTDPEVIGKLIEAIKSIYKPGTKIVEIGGGLGYITEALIGHFDDVDCIEFDDELFEVLYKKLVHNKNLAYLKEKSDNSNKYFIHRNKSEEKDNKKKEISKNTKFIQESSIRLIKGDILDYQPSEGEIYKSRQEYILVGNIPFHISGKLYRKFMSEIDPKPYGMVFITDKQYARTLMGQPPRCYRVSLQAQSYGDIEIISDVSPASVYPEPKVMSCIMKITHNPTKLPKNFWEVVNYHFENFPTKEVESPKTVGLEGWIKLAKNKL